MLGIKFPNGRWSTLPLPQTLGYLGLILTSPAAPPPPGGCAQESRGPRSAPGDLHSGGENRRSVQGPRAPLPPQIPRRRVPAALRCCSRRSHLRAARSLRDHGQPDGRRRAAAADARTGSFPQCTAPGAGSGAGTASARAPPTCSWSPQRPGAAGTSGAPKAGSAFDPKGGLAARR